MKITRTKISGSGQRLVLSCWIMAALLLIGYNSSRLMTLLSPPIPGHSMEVKLASQKWRQLQNKLSQGLVESTQAIDLDLALLGAPPDSVKKKSKLPDVGSDENQTVTQTKIKLPSLSGILRNTDIHGRAYAAAVIDGQRLKENDRIQGFRIRKILEDGVELSSNGQTWFLRAPEVVYSRVHAIAAEGKDSQ